MKLTESQIEIMKEDIFADLVSILVEKYNYTMHKAMDVLYNSKLFAKIQDTNTGLYYQSPGYVLSYLEGGNV